VEAEGGCVDDVSGGNGRWSAIVESDCYRERLQAMGAQCGGERPLPARIDLMCGAGMVLLGGRESRRRGRLTPVGVDELRADASGFDGHSFTVEYRGSVR